MSEKERTVLEDINHLYKIIKPEGLDIYKQTYQLSKGKKAIFKKYLDCCKELLLNDIETKIKTLKGDELIKFIKNQNDRRAFGTLASIERNYKKLNKKEQDANWFAMTLLIGLQYYEITYNTKIINENDFKNIN